MWHFFNEKINKNDLTRKKQTNPEYKINIGSKLKPHSTIPPSDSKMHEREREGGLALDAASLSWKWWPLASLSLQAIATATVASSFTLLAQPC